eukprot:gi/632976881/ref/XP_007905036.1/ PREDICTED: protein phosphatase 1 regulatory subunit 37-like [Callorhinchus milii]
MNVGGEELQPFYDDARIQLGKALAVGWKIKPTKHVSFPADAKIVSGSIEPCNPWGAVRPTVEEIIASYKLSCKKLGVKPIDKLLKQLQEITEVHHRIKCLDLQGEVLDYESCESLESVFRSVRFEWVNLERAKLDENGAAALFDIMEYYESAVRLSISFSAHIGSRGWMAAAQLIRKSSCLREFEACGVALTEHPCRYMTKALRFSQSLVGLRLEDAGLSGLPLMLLVSALKVNRTLQELHLADNQLNSLQDAMQLGELLKCNSTIRLLDLKNNCISNAGLEDICGGLREQRHRLRTLVLWNNKLTRKGMAHLAATLPHLTALETLNLGHNYLNNEGIFRLKEALIANRSIVRLGLASTSITCEGAIAAAEFVAESTALLRLDLRRNRIGTAGLMALSLALKINDSLVRLDLETEIKRETLPGNLNSQQLDSQFSLKTAGILPAVKHQADPIKTAPESCAVRWSLGVSTDRMQFVLGFVPLRSGAVPRKPPLLFSYSL